MKKNVIVCEGYHDLEKIKKAMPDVECVVTDGSKVSEETIKLIKKLSINSNIIIFTDPDYPGERIRTIVSEAVPSAKHAFIKKDICISNNHKKVGVEHASIEEIKKSLETLLVPTTKSDELTNNDLYDLKLNGDVNSAKLRDKISDKLNIGKPNAKTFLKRLNLVGISKKELEELICQINMEINMK